MRPIVCLVATAIAFCCLCGLAGHASASSMNSTCTYQTMDMHQPACLQEGQALELAAGRGMTNVQGSRFNDRKVESGESKVVTDATDSLDPNSDSPCTWTSSILPTLNSQPSALRSSTLCSFDAAPPACVPAACLPRPPRALQRVAPALADERACLPASRCSSVLKKGRERPRARREARRGG